MTSHRTDVPKVIDDRKERDQAIVHQRHVMGLSYRAIGRLHGISAARAMQIVGKAKKKTA